MIEYTLYIPEKCDDDRYRYLFGEKCPKCRESAGVVIDLKFDNGSCSCTKCDEIFSIQEFLDMVFKNYEYIKVYSTEEDLSKGLYVFSDFRFNKKSSVEDIKSVINNLEKII